MLMRGWNRLVAAVLAILMTGCPNPPSNAPKTGNGGPDSGTVDRAKGDPSARLRNDPAAIARHNQAVAVMNQFRYSEARDILGELAGKFPGDLEIQVDYAIALAQAVGTAERAGASTFEHKLAIPLLKEVLGKDPKNGRARYTLGCLFELAGEMTGAKAEFQAAADLDPSDAWSRTKLGLINFQNQPRFETDAEEAAYMKREVVGPLEKALELDPYLLSARNVLSQALRRTGDDAAADAQQTLFDRLNVTAFERRYSTTYLFMGPKAELQRLPSSADPIKPPAGPLFADAVPLIRLPGSLTGPVSIAAVEIDGRPGIDLLVTAPTGSLALLRAANGSFQPAPVHPLTKTAGREALFGDLDHDGHPDALIVGETLRLLKQPGPGGWVDGTAASKLVGKGTGGRLLDLDHDGDLDVLLFGNSPGVTTFMNTGAGEFKPGETLAADAGIIRRVLAADLDGDRAFDLLVLPESGKPRVLLNELTLKFKPAGKGFEALADTPIRAAAAADLDADGAAEVVLAGDSGLVIARRDRLTGTWSRAAVPAAGAVDAARTAESLTLADIDGSGRRLAFLAGPGGVTLLSLDQAPSPDVRLGSGAVVGMAALALDAGKGPSAVVVTGDGMIRLFPPGSGRHPYLSLTLDGHLDNRTPPRRSNRSGIGTKVAARFGDRWNVGWNVGESSGPGQSVMPIELGLGGATNADFVNFDWPNGDFQAELNLAVGKPLSIKETDRTIQSCPILFAWNGERFEFVTDLLAVGGIDYFLEPGKHHTPSDPRENLPIPERLLRPKDGRLELRLVEPAEEITFLDRAELSCVEVPPGWSFTLDERHSCLPPAPTHEPRFYRRTVELARATDETGRDVTEALRLGDFQAAPMPPADPLFAARHGSPQTLTLRFTAPIDLPGAMLLAEGWVDYPNSTTVVSALQAGADYTAPSLEARAGTGEWVTVYPAFGYVAGMQRAMSLPLVGLPKGTDQLRIRTTLRLAWDRFRVALAEPCPEARFVKLPLVEATVSRRGFHQLQRGQAERPFFEWERMDPRMSARFPIGSYTRFGAITELVAAEDDALAIVGPGEEVALRFTAPAAAVPADWSRTFVLSSTGWCRGIDNYSRNSLSVGPLPSLGEDPAIRRRLHAKYNTRMEQGVVTQRLRAESAPTVVPRPLEKSAAEPDSGRSSEAR
jgi:tetratricopeptide (TPR) repeat protein